MSSCGAPARAGPQARARRGKRRAAERSGAALIIGRRNSAAQRDKLATSSAAQVVIGIGIGASLADLKARMGHDSARASLIYQHATATADSKIANALGLAIDAEPDKPGAGAGS